MVRGKFLLLLTALIALLPFPPTVRAAVINYAGVQTEVGVYWRAIFSTKLLDIDGDDVLGTDGYYMVNFAPSLPGYLSQMTILTTVYGGDSGYASIENPNNISVNFLTGTMLPYPGTGVSTNIFQFVVNSNAVDRTIRVGLMVDNLDIAGFNAANFTLIQTSGAGATSGLVPATAAALNDQLPDWVFFDITGAAAGDTFVIQGTGGNDGFACLGGVTFDSLAALVVTNLANSGPGTLRTLISGNSVADVTVRFASNLSGQTITLTSGEILLTNNIFIDASSLPGGIMINGNHSSRVFEVAANVTATLACLTVTNGASGNSGGGIYNAGSLTLNRCSIAGNSVSNGTAGGGIYNATGSLVLNQCTVAGNSATLGQGIGGGICNQGDGGRLILNQSTLSGNSAGTGGGIGGIYTTSVSISVFNSIVAGNTANYGTDFDINTGPYRSLSGNNVVSDDPVLAPLGNYGGPTPTMPPLSGSPAIDAGSDSAINAPYAFTTDQRGYPRLAGAHVDIGAVETQPTVVTTNADSGAGSLRTIVSNASPASIVTFAANLSGQTIMLTSGEIPVTGLVNVDASALPGGITLNGNGISRIFNLASGANAILTCLNLTNCHTSDAGGAIYGAAGSSLQIERCTFSGNNAIEGGAILNDGTLLMENCTLSANNGSYGGALQCRNATVLNNCTIARNNAPNGGGGVFNKGSTLTLNNCIVAINTGGSDLYNQLSSVVYSNANLIQTIVYDRATGTNGPTPLTSSPLLKDLGNYGGPVPTMPMIAGSPAIDAGGTTALVIDQRGLPRVINAVPDLGAVEFGISNAVVTTIADSGFTCLRYSTEYSMPGSTVTFDPSLSGQTITLMNGRIPLTASLTIDASSLPGGVVISGNNASGILTISSNTAVALNNLSLVNGSAGQNNGGTILNNGVLTMTSSTMSGNQAISAGAILNNATLTMVACTLSSNQSTSTGAGAGAIQNFGTANFTNCTLTGNQSSGGGGAIYGFGSSTVYFTACTLTGNQAPSGGGGAILDFGAAHFTNCIIAGNTNNRNADLAGPGSFTAVGSLTNGDPHLATLGNYGGPTQTMSPLPGSPAIDAGVATSLTTDQRGFPRVLGMAPDIGAVEGIYDTNGPGRLIGVTRLASGSSQFTFTNLTDVSFTVLASTNLQLPLTNWINLGPAVESPVGSGHFQFTDPQATNYPQRFYRVRTP